jgi:nitronate monooxygenase
MTPAEKGAAARALLENSVLPVIAAPMFLVTGPELVIAACKAGIMSAAAFATARTAEEYDEWLGRIEEELNAFRKETGRQPAAFAANLSAGADRLGRRDRFEKELENCRRRRIKFVFTVGGSPAQIVKEVHGWGGYVFHDATTIRHAEKAVEAGVDGLVLIAGGGGGHAGLLNPFAFVPEVRRFFDGAIILGGAISTGHGVLAAQALGADLCYMGTRFIATRESMAPQAYKEMLVATPTSEVIYTPVFTHGVPCNFMKTSIRANGFDPDTLSLTTTPLDPLFQVRKPWRDIWAAGHGVGLIDDIPTVAELVERLKREYADARTGLGAL